MILSRVLRLRPWPPLLLSLVGQLLGSDSFAVFQSLDGGDTWTHSSRGLPTHARINAVLADGPRVLAGTDAGLFRSDDDGASWAPVTVLAESPPRILAITVHAGRIFLGTDRHGLIASADRGRIWTRKAGVASVKIRSLLGVGTTLYAGTDAESVQVSDDAGETWTPLGKGWPPLGQAFALAELDGRIYAGLYSQGLHRWNEGAASWERVGNGVPLALASTGGTLVAGHNPGGLHASHDAGARWEQGRIRTAPSSGLFDTLAPSQDGPVWEMAGDAERVFAGVGPGILRTTDRGRTWSRLAGGLPEEAPGIAFWVRGVRVFAAVRLPQPEVAPATAPPTPRPTPNHNPSPR